MKKKYVVSIAEIATEIGSVGCWIMTAYKFVTALYVAVTQGVTDLEVYGVRFVAWCFIASVLFIIHERIDEYKDDLEFEDDCDEYEDDEE